MMGVGDEEGDDGILHEEEKGYVHLVAEPSVRQDCQDRRSLPRNP